MTPCLVRVVLADDHPMYRVNQVPQGNRASTPTAVPSVRRSAAKASEDTKPVCPVRCSRARPAGSDRLDPKSDRGAGAG